MEIDKKIGEILNGFEPALVLMTANHLKIFDELAGEPVSADDISQKLNLSQKGTLRLLNALVALEISSKKDNRYQLMDSCRPFLSKDGDRCMHQWIRLMFSLVPVWLELPQFVKTGSFIKSIMEVLGNDPHETRAFIDAMHDKGLKATWLMAREIPLGDYKHLLDIGGGPGTYSLEWAKLHHNLKATVFDIPPVVEVAKSYIQKYDLGDRVNTIGGDFKNDDFGSGYDLILIANVLHMYDEDQAKFLLQKAINTLSSKGRIILHGFCTDGDDTSPLNDVLFSLNIALLTPGGRAHPVAEKINWLKQFGIQEVQHFRIDAIPTGVLTGIKP